MSMKNANARLAQDQGGFAAIVIAFVMILVLSLLTVGFAQLMRKEQRNALDRQLSSQAYYAAESGINDAAKALSAGYDGSKAYCDPVTAALHSVDADRKGASYLSNNNISDSTGSSYTCLTIDQSPSAIEFGSIPVGQSKVTEITGADPITGAPVAINKLSIGWQDSSGGHSFISPTSDRTFRTATNWGAATGVLRVGVTPIDSISRSALTSGTYTAFLYPNTGSGTAGTSNYATGQNSGDIIPGNCKTSTNRDCQAEIRNLNNNNSYLLTLRSIYKNTLVTIKAYGVSGAQIDIANSQTVVDSTGKAQDVLKRIQVRIPTKNNYDHTDYGICKQYQLTPTTGSNDCATLP